MAVIVREQAAIAQPSRLEPSSEEFTNWYALARLAGLEPRRARREHESGSMPMSSRSRGSAARGAASSPTRLLKSRAFNAGTEKADHAPDAAGDQAHSPTSSSPSSRSATTGNRPAPAPDPPARGSPKRPGFSPPPRKDQPQEGRSPRDAPSLTLDTKAQRFQPQRSRCRFTPAVGKNCRNRE